jgi:hypothetical protein
MSMTHDQIERCDALWQELADTARVRWMPGMLARNIVDADHPLQRILRRFGAADTRVWSPVWTDPATIGCLVAMAREATGDASLHVEWPDALDGHCYACGDSGYSAEDNEPEALLTAIKEATR